VDKRGGKRLVGEVQCHQRVGHCGFAVMINTCYMDGNCPNEKLNDELMMRLLITSKGQLMLAIELVY